MSSGDYTHADSYDDSAYKQCLADKAAAQAKVDAQQLVVDDLTQVQEDLKNRLQEVSDLKDSYTSTYGKVNDIGSVVDISPVSQDMSDTQDCINNMFNTLTDIKATCDKDLETALQTLADLKAEVDSYSC